MAIPDPVTPVIAIGSACVPPALISPSPIKIRDHCLGSAPGQRCQPWRHPAATTTMPHRSISLAERLSQGLASAVLTAAALAVPTAEAAAPAESRLAQNPGAASQTTAREPAAPSDRNRSANSRRAAVRGPSGGSPTTTSPSSAGAKAKPASTGKAAPAAGCGAHEGGCGPSR